MTLVYACVETFLAPIGINYLSISSTGNDKRSRSLSISTTVRRTVRKEKSRKIRPVIMKQSRATVYGRGTTVRTILTAVHTLDDSILVHCYSTFHIYIRYFDTSFVLRSPRPKAKRHQDIPSRSAGRYPPPPPSLINTLFVAETCASIPPPAIYFWCSHP